MPNGTSPQILVDGLDLPEGPRWRTTAPGEGKLWFVDILAGKVMAVDLSGSVETIAEVNVPVGLGFTTDGTLLVTSPPKASCWPYATAHKKPSPMCAPPPAMSAAKWWWTILAAPFSAEATPAS